MTIAIADFLDLADSIACQAQMLAVKLGTGVEPDSASLGGENNIARILALVNPDEVEDLLKGFREQLKQCLTTPVAYNRFSESMRALNIHVDGINQFLTDEGERVAPEFKTAIELLGIESLDGANTFSPVVDPMDTILITAGNTATFTHVASINPDNYYASNLILKKTTAAGGADAITITLKMTKFDLTTENKAVSVNASDAINTTYDIGIHGTNMYLGADSLVSIVCIVGSAGQAWKVMSELERTVAL